MFWLNFFLGVACAVSAGFAVAMVRLIWADYRVMRARASVRATWQAPGR